MERNVKLFVPGRLCLFGEHSDWAAMYRVVNKDICKGAAIVTGIEQGIYATAESSDRFILIEEETGTWECEMNSQMFRRIAEEGGYYSYAAGTVSYLMDTYGIQSGVRIIVEKQDLPVKSGLSSSAAICVLVARAFNQIHHLNMSVLDEMEAAFEGERRTPSRCGKMDQACAFGEKQILMEFDGSDIEVRELPVGGTFYLVIADLLATKDTVRILEDLNRSYPYAKNETDRLVQEALGLKNSLVIQQAKEALKSGDARELGSLMRMAQKLFDSQVMPACEELKAPVLHSVLQDPELEKWIYGAKGVGSQGDGTVQFVAKSLEDAFFLQNYLQDEYRMPSFTLTIKPVPRIRKAVIPLAGFATRVYPASKCISKCFLPLMDKDGLLKPALLILLQELKDAGIEEIALIIGEDEQAAFEHFFALLPEEQLSRLPEEKQEIERFLQKIRPHITFLYQKERRGFGHAVWQAKEFTRQEPVLLLLGDFVYRSASSKSCTEQFLEAYRICGKTLISLMEVPAERVENYGIAHGTHLRNHSFLKLDRMVEKPSRHYAETELGMENSNGERIYYAPFGQYILMPEVFEKLEEEICSGTPSEGNEFGLTKALTAVSELYGYVPVGKSFDIGLPETYRSAMQEFPGENESR